MNWLLISGALCGAADAPRVAFAQKPGKVLVTIGGEPVATYVYADKDIPRPYFAHVRAPGGIQVTRNHPPIKGKDPTDHAAYHPGIWTAFGDISGSDYWRNKARVVHKEFVEKPAGGPARGTFAVRNLYLERGDPGEVNCTEVCRYTFLVRPSGYLVICDSTFSAGEREFFFGDQEEMGLGVRVTTPITVRAGGTILNADGLKNERRVWGRASAWCDYSGVVGGQHVGVTLMPDPANFRRSWFHARDYGLLVANPFGRRAFRKGPESRVVVRPGRPLRLRFGVLLHAAPAKDKPDLKAAHADYLRLIAKRPPRTALANLD